MKQPFLEETHNKPAPWSKGGSHLCEAERRLLWWLDRMLVTVSVTAASY